jgi:hypothetical protein
VTCFRFALPAAILVFVLGCSTQPQQPTAESAAKQPQSLPKITQFYVQNSSIGKGEKTLLCYGVENASTVRLSPPVDKVWPAQTRCLEVSPTETTTYTLTAEDAAGHSTSKSAELTVGAPRPHIIEVVVSSLDVPRGQPVRVCYSARNATSVKAGPGQYVGAHTPDKGCLLDTPQKTTTYEVTVTGRDGSTDTEHATVKVH